MTLEEIGEFSAYLSSLCATEPQATATMTTEFMAELRRAALEEAKSALRAVVATGKVPFGPAKIIGAVLSVLADRRREETARTGGFRPLEHDTANDPAYLEKRRRLEEIRPHWDALDEDDRRGWVDIVRDEKLRERGLTGRPLTAREERIALGPENWIVHEAMMRFADQEVFAS